MSPRKQVSRKLVPLFICMLASVSCYEQEENIGKVTDLRTSKMAVRSSIATVTHHPANPIAFCNGLSGYNVIIGTSNNDNITGTAGNDCIVALGAQDIVNALGGDDIVFAGDGDDQVNGGAGNDQIFGGSGQDILNGMDGNDTIDGEDGDDRVRGGVGDDILRGGQGQDQLYGEAGNDSVTGGTGDDRLYGGPGDDHLEDCENHNRFYGVWGTDVCRGETSPSSPNSSQFYSCETVVPCTTDPLPLVNDAATLLNSPGMTDFNNLIGASENIVPPLVSAANDVLALVLANADLLTDPSTLTQNQRNRLIQLNNTIQSSAFYTTVSAAGQALLDDPAALNAAIDQWIDAATTPAPYIGPFPTEACGAGTPEISNTMNAFSQGANAIAAAVGSAATQASFNRIDFVSSLQTPFNAGLLLMSDLMETEIAGTSSAAQGIKFNLGRFLRGAGEAVLGGAAVVVGGVSVVAGVATGNPLLVAGGIGGIAVGAPLVLQGAHDLEGSFSGSPECPFAILNCLGGCPSGYHCVSGCCLANEDATGVSLALVETEVVVCASNETCTSPAFCNDDGCCETDCGGDPPCYTGADCDDVPCPGGAPAFCNLQTGASNGCCMCSPQ